MRISKEDFNNLERRIQYLERSVDENRRVEHRQNRHVLYKTRQAYLEAVNLTLWVVAISMIPIEDRVRWVNEQREMIMSVKGMRDEAL